MADSFSEASPIRHHRSQVLVRGQCDVELPESGYTHSRADDGCRRNLTSSEDRSRAAVVASPTLTDDVDLRGDPM